MSEHEALEQEMLGNILWNGDQRGWPLRIKRAVIQAILDASLATVRARDEEIARMQDVRHIQIRFDGPPAHESGRFIEVEDPEDGCSISCGEWVQDGDDWLLKSWVRTNREHYLDAEIATLKARVEELEGDNGKLRRYQFNDIVRKANREDSDGAKKK